MFSAHRRAGSLLALLFFTFFVCSSLGAQTAPGAAGKASSEPGPADPQELEAFLDSLLGESMPEQGVPGLVFVLVKDGRVFFSKGYGYADLERKIPADPSMTLFPVGSLSKLMTATAVMQLHERGEIDLTADVNMYLNDFRLDDTFVRPVTMAHLLTHTAGFELRHVGIAARREKDVRPLNAYLASELPPRLHPPGETYSYSHLGMSLAGYVVQEVTGVPFQKYADANILRPLGMTSSSFRSSAQRDPRTAVGYVYGNGAYRRIPTAYPNVVPAGGLVTTGADMGRFMIAQLNGGQLENESSRILQESTVHEMQRRHFSYHPRLAGSAYGFYEYPVNGEHGLAHEGWLGGSSSYMHLLPERNVGLFIATNTADSRRLRTELIEKFHDRYYIAGRQSQNGHLLPVVELKHAERFEGVYRVESYPRTGIERLGLILLAKQIRIRRQDGGTLVMERDGAALTLQQVEPFLFQFSWKEVPYYFAFDGAGGEVSRLFFGLDTYERIGWYETQGAQRLAAVVLILVFLSACIIWGARYVRHRTWRAVRKAKALRVAVAYTATVCVLNVLFIVGMARQTSFPRSHSLVFGPSGAMIVLLLIPFVSSVLASGLPILCVFVWTRSGWSRMARVHYSLVVVAALALIPIFAYMHLLDWRAFSARRSSAYAVQPSVIEPAEVATRAAVSRATW